MDGLKERESAAEALYIHESEAAMAQRFRRIRGLGHWACKMMKTSPEGETRYQELLYRLAVSSLDDSVVVERVRDDVAAAGVRVSIDSVGRILATPEGSH